MGRVNKTISNLQKIWNDLDVAYEKMETVLEALNLMVDLPDSLVDSVDRFDMSAISNLKNEIEMIMETKSKDYK